jgi:hypothetical protein
MEDRLMSLLLFLFYWIGIPVLVISAAFWMWRQAVTPLARGGVVGLCIAVLLGLLWLAAGEKWLADRQVRELCAKDGGVKVYETVPLTPDLLDKAGRIWIPYQEQSKSTDEYYYLVSFEYIASGRVKVTRRVSQIVRKSDGKVLGERTSYSRSGGDLPGPWHSSRYLCPDLAKNPDFESLIFVKGDWQ